MLLEDSPVATAVLGIAGQGIDWTGAPLNLYHALSRIAGKKLGARWPKTMHVFGSDLRRIAPQLRVRGISITFERKRDARIITLRSEGQCDELTGANASDS